MRKSVFIVGVGIIVVVGYLLYCYGQPRYSPSTVPFIIRGKTYHFLTAKNSTEWEKGLMDIRKLKGADGMVFLFNDYQYRTFWNKNTLMNLNLLWMKDAEVVGESILPSIEKSGGIITVTSPLPVNIVVEIPQ